MSLFYNNLFCFKTCFLIYTLESIPSNEGYFLLKETTGAFDGPQAHFWLASIVIYRCYLLCQHRLIIFKFWLVSYDLQRNTSYQYLTL